MNDWQPIETAPKTKLDNSGDIGETISLLGYCPGPEEFPLESCFCVIWWEPPFKNARHRGIWLGEGVFDLHPTHWMPLPEPPTCAPARVVAPP